MKTIKEVIEYLKDWRAAYPEEMFAPLTNKDAADIMLKPHLNELISRNSAQMGRHIMDRLLSWIEEPSEEEKLSINPVQVPEFDVVSDFDQKEEKKPQEWIEEFLKNVDDRIDAETTKGEGLNRELVKIGRAQAKRIIRKELPLLGNIESTETELSISEQEIESLFTFTELAVFLSQKIQAGEVIPFVSFRSHPAEEIRPYIQRDKLSPQFFERLFKMFRASLDVNKKRKLFSVPGLKTMIEINKLEGEHLWNAALDYFNQQEDQKQEEMLSQMLDECQDHIIENALDDGTEWFKLAEFLAGRIPLNLSPERYIELFSEYRRSCQTMPILTAPNQAGVKKLAQFISEQTVDALSKSGLRQSLMTEDLFEGMLIEFFKDDSLRAEAPDKIDVTPVESEEKVLIHDREEACLDSAPPQIILHHTADRTRALAEFIIADMRKDGCNSQGRTVEDMERELLSAPHPWHEMTGPALGRHLALKFGWSAPYMGGKIEKFKEQEMKTQIGKFLAGFFKFKKTEAEREQAAESLVREEQEFLYEGDEQESREPEKEEFKGDVDDLKNCF